MTSKRASLLLRVVARGIDIVLALSIAEALPKAGWLAGLVYILICDGLFDGRSLGKRLIRLKVLSENGGPCSVKGSVLRNGTLGAGFLLWKLPYIGWVFLCVVLALESVVLLGSPDGMRIGDEMAKTQVVEANEAVQETP